jgi:chromosome segregation ATPase
MPDFHEQLTSIAELRERCRRCEEDLYRARLELQQVEGQLLRAEQGQTVVDGDRDRAAAEERAIVARANARLAAAREESRQVAHWFTQLAEHRALEAHLSKNVSAAESRIAALRRELAELLSEAPARPDAVQRIEDELERARSVQEDLHASVKKATGARRRLEEDEASKRRQQEELRAQAATVRDELRAAQARLVETLRPAFRDRQSLEERRA